MRFMQLSGAGLGCGIFFCVVCIISSVFAAIFMGDLRDYVDSSDWASAQGSVISASIESSTDSDSTTYRARVTYFYFAGDRRYESDRVYFGDDVYTSDQGGVRKTVEKYRNADTINVLYNPNDPSNAVIERRLGSGIYIFFGVIGFIILIGGIIFGAIIIKSII